MVVLRSWQPSQERLVLQRPLDRLFEEMMITERNAPTSWQPAVELEDRKDNLVLRAELPGIQGKDLDVQVTNKAVAISGERRYRQETKQKRSFRSEFSYGKFGRVVLLPVAVHNNQVKAEFTNGILTLTLPKVEVASKRVVKLNLVEAVPAQDAAQEQPVNIETDDVWESETAAI